MSVPMHDTDWTIVTTKAKHTPGVCATDWTTGKKYCYIKNMTATAIAAGDLVGVNLTEAWGQVSMDAATQHVSSDGTTAVSLVAGVGISAIAGLSGTTYSYGWIQVGGLCTNITTDLSIVVGDPMYCADNAKTATTAQPAHWHGKFGYGLATDASTLLASSMLTDCIFDR